MEHYVYIVECADKTYYTGYSVNVLKRVLQHNKGCGAKYTRTRRPVTLVYEEICSDKSAALRREYAIKKMSRKQKEKLVQSFYKRDDG